ncbi:MAG: hypothetical protein B7Z83_11115, partial [Thiomonas sp. 20-64-5]
MALLLASASALADTTAAPPQTQQESPLDKTASWPNPDISQTSHEMYQMKEPITLSARATALASAEWLKTGFAPSMVGTNGITSTAQAYNSLSRELLSALRA